MTLTRGENFQSSMLPELVRARAHGEAELLQEELLLEVDAALRAVLGEGGDRDVEVVLADVSAVAQDVLAPEDVRVAHLEVVGLGLEVQLQRLQGRRVQEQEVRRLHVREVAEGRDLERVLRVRELPVRRVRGALDVEGAEAGVDDPRAPAVAALVGHPAAVREVLVDPEVHLRLARAPVLERPLDVRAVGGIDPSAGEDRGVEGVGHARRRRERSPRPRPRAGNRGRS